MKMRLEDAGTMTDSHGTETTVSVLFADDIPVALIHSQDHAVRYNDDSRHTEHVIQGLEFRTEGKGFFDREVLSHASCPSRSMMNVTIPSLDAELPDMAQVARDDYDWSNGFSFLKYGEKGAAIPDDASDAFMRGVKAASQRFGRMVRSGKLTGNPRSW
jgi:hypothetical protein